MSEERKSKFCDLTFRSAVLDALGASIAVVDPNGEIVAVNASWQDFAIANQMKDRHMGIGANYLAVCRAAKADPDARTALEGLHDIMKGYQSFFYHEYPCHSPRMQRWFAIRATPLTDYPTFISVSHEDITDRISAEEPGQLH